MAIRSLFVAILLAGLGFPMGCMANNEETFRIVVETPSIDTLKFKLSNNSNDRITIKTWQAPWTLSVPYPLAVSVHVLDSETNRPRVSDQAGMHTNEVIGDVTIEPDSSIVGEVNVRSRFHDAESGDVPTRYIVHWTYSLPVCDVRKTYVNAGAAERDGKSFRIIFQETLEIAAAERCGKIDKLASFPETETTHR